ncbi:MAG: RsmB/NOP family class I SAM-dependent RNA methyltransferase, partial [Pseudomonadota bacterium]
AMNDLQSRILRSAARLVRPGGRLIYVTCSLLHRENQAQIETFQSENPNFRPISASDSPRIGELTLSDGSLLLTPGRHGTDGFFIAVLEAG